MLPVQALKRVQALRMPQADLQGRPGLEDSPGRCAAGVGEPGAEIEAKWAQIIKCLLGYVKESELYLEGF